MSISAEVSLASTVKLVHEMTGKSWRKDQRDQEGVRCLPGFGLLHLESYHRDLRVKRVYLSTKGQKLMEALNHLPQGESV